MERKIIYKLKENIDLNELAKIGWDIIPNDNDLIFFKIVPQPLESDLCRHLLNQYYQNKEWQEKIYKQHEKIIKKEIGVKYDKNGNLKMTPKLENNLKMWRIETNQNDGFWVGLKSFDPNDRHYFYSKQLLDKYCKEEIEKLKELNLIEEFEAE